MDIRVILARSLSLQRDRVTYRRRSLILHLSGGDTSKRMTKDGGQMKNDL
ncbi:MAG: hypothetical protein RID53_25050 [Coleofasciculus sp. B1-GNL1-01]